LPILIPVPKKRLILYFLTTAQRCRSATEKNVLEDHFSSVFSQFKKYHPSGNLKFSYLGNFQSLKLCIFMEKNLFNFP